MPRLSSMSTRPQSASPWTCRTRRGWSHVETRSPAMPRMNTTSGRRRRRPDTRSRRRRFVRSSRLGVAPQKSLRSARGAVADRQWPCERTARTGWVAFPVARAEAGASDGVDLRAFEKLFLHIFKGGNPGFPLQDPAFHLASQRGLSGVGVGAVAASRLTRLCDLLLVLCHSGLDDATYR